MSEENLTPYEQFHHSCKWHWLVLRLDYEHQTELVRAMMRSVSNRPERLKLHGTLAKAMIGNRR